MRSIVKPDHHAFIYREADSSNWHWTVNAGLLSVQGSEPCWTLALAAADTAMRHRIEEEYK